MVVTTQADLEHDGHITDTGSRLRTQIERAGEHALFPKKAKAGTLPGSEPSNVTTLDMRRSQVEDRGARVEARPWT